MRESRDDDVERLSGIRHDDRSISDIVGFVLMFGIIITSVGLVATVGLSQLSEFEERQQIRNAERTMDLISRSFDEIEETQAPVRTDAIDLAGGSVTVDEDSYLNVSVRNASDTITAANVSLNALAYELGDTEFAYENGAAFQTVKGDDNGIMFREPGFVCTADRAIISVVTVRADQDRQISGESTLRITGRRTNSSLLYPAGPEGSGQTASDAEAVELDFTYAGEDRSREWRLHFADENNWTWDDSDGSATCGSSLEAVYVRHTVLTITYS